MYDMIAEIKTKLDFIINHFILEKEGLLSEGKKSVNISASGIRFTVNTPVKEGDLMKIKLLLPTYPPVAVFAYGAVKRVTELDNGTYEISLEYLNMNDSVRKEIIQYTLSYQRETIKKFKETPDTE
jgi:c-di-GMP-binding flagellar brake protein YcgR